MQSPLMDMTETVRLTSLAHGGGCGCKIAPAVLQDILKGMPQAAPFANLLVGTETSDDAAVWRLNDQQALVATTDFFMPVVDDPFDFGRIAATNALSDVYAMGATPILALAIVGMPVSSLSTDTLGRILQGGAAVCAAAGVPGAGLSPPGPCVSSRYSTIAPVSASRSAPSSITGDLPSGWMALSSGGASMVFASRW